MYADTYNQQTYNYTQFVCLILLGQGYPQKFLTLKISKLTVIATSSSAINPNNLSYIAYSIATFSNCTVKQSVFLETI